jgi:ERCC4-type nuclease
LRTLKLKENSTTKELDGTEWKKRNPKTKQTKESQDVMQKNNAVETLASIRKVNMTDANNLLSNYGSLQDIILHDNLNDFTYIDGIGNSKLESLKACFLGEFTDK